MTIKEFYEWAISHVLEDYELGIQFCNDWDTCELHTNMLSINSESKNIIIIQPM